MNRDQFLAKGRMRQAKQAQAQQEGRTEPVAAVPAPAAGVDNARRPPRDPEPDPKTVEPGRRP